MIAQNKSIDFSRSEVIKLAEVDFIFWSFPLVPSDIVMSFRRLFGIYSIPRDPNSMLMVARYFKSTHVETSREIRLKKDVTAFCGGNYQS